MHKKKFLLVVVLLIAGQMAAQTPQLVAVKADKSETVYSLSDVQEIVFESNTMTVITSGTNAKGITNIRFLNAPSTELKTLQSEASVFVFPNPVQTNLTVFGIDKGVKINLLDLKGTVLKSIPAQENSIDINVSSLPQGIYLLQIEKRMIKFIKN